MGWAAVIVALLAGAIGAGSTLAAGGGLPAGTITVSPAPVALRDGQVITVTGSNFASRAAVVVVQCSVRAAVPTSATSASFRSLPRAPEAPFTARFRVHPVIETAAGTIDCRTTTCLIGAENLGDRSQLAASGVTFAPGGTASSPPATVRRPPVLAPLAGDVGGGRVGEVVRARSRGVPRRPVSGEGLLQLTMSAPRTSWRSARDTSVVVQVAVDGGQPQTMVLFAGARPFTYEGFTGPLRTGPHRLSVQVRPDLSRTADVVPTAVVRGAQLLVAGGCTVGRRPVVRRRPVAIAGRLSPSARRAEDCRSHSLALAYSPVLYDRRVVAHSDTPLLTYATVRPLAGGAHRISYVVVWSNEDAGTGFVPFLLAGGFGRLSDIEDALSLTVDRHGRVHDPRLPRVHDVRIELSREPHRARRDLHIL